MDFNTNQAIYLQIADYVCDQLLTGQWKENDKIPSVRELGVNMEVNPNTVMRAYEFLQQQDIIYTKRGMGFFAQEHSAKKIKQIRKEQFLNEELPQLFRKMDMLNIDFEEVRIQFERTQKTDL